ARPPAAFRYHAGMTTTSNGQRIALVTGANKGIGFEIARGLAKAGMHVLLGSRDLGRGREAASRLAGEGYSATAVLLDVTNPVTVTAAASQTDSAHGKLDVLVNNAGIALEWQSKPSNVDLGLVKQVYETNVFGVIAVTQAMLPLLRRSKAGRIVNVSSSLGSLCFTSDPANDLSQFLLLGYNTSKTALNAVTVQFANEL